MVPMKPPTQESMIAWQQQQIQLEQQQMQQ
jgi:hypothetical protein